MRFSSRTALAVVLAVTLLGACRPAPAGEVVKRRLGNGVTLIVVPSPWNKVAAVSVIVDAGSKYDPPELRGLARVTNEFLISGTTTMPRAELEDLIDSRGIKLGTYTTEDFAEVYVASTVDQFDAALDVISALMAQPAFDTHELPRAQRQAFDEYERSQNDPFESCYAKLNELLFGDHPYGFPAHGTKEGVSATTRDDVLRFYTERYRGGNIVVAAVGDFPADEAMRKLGERFAGCASGRAAGRAFPISAPTEPVQFEFHRDVAQGYVTVGFAVPPMGSDDCAAVRVLGSVLGEGKAATGRVQEALLAGDAGAADMAGAFCPERIEQGRMVLFASTPDLNAAVEALTRVVERVRTEPVPGKELAQAKDRLVGQVILSGQANLERARRLATGEIARLGLGFTDEFLRKIEAEDAVDVQRAAAKYLTNPVTVILRPGRVSRTQL
jgi:predicted Zn-dependent peptidase